MTKLRRVRDFGLRLSQSAFGASAAGMLAAVGDAAWATKSEGAAGAAGPTLSSVAAANAGLLAPFSLGLGLAFGVASVLLWPNQPPSPKSLVTTLRDGAVGRQATVSAFAPLAVVAAFLWTTSVAQLARLILTLDAPPRLVGIALAGAGVALFAFYAAFALAVTPSLRLALARLADKRRRAVDPVTTGACALGLVAILLVYGATTGTISGEGGPLGVYGILRRPELDLRAPLLAVAIALGALFGPATLWRRRGVLTFALAAATLLLTARARDGLARTPDVVEAIERGAPLGRLALGPLRRMADRDHDGASGWFGGGDCDDTNPAVHPSAEEIVDNGIDEDCSGADLTRETLEALAPPPPETPPEAKASIPDDLNVVLITIDTLRHDLGYMGYERPVSPNLDALASQSVVFERAYSLASYTGKSIGPMLIGKYGSETNRNWGHFNKFDEKDTFVAERLQRQGVRTMAVHAHRYFDVWGGLERGFDVLDMSAAPPKDAKWDVDNKATGGPLTDAALAVLQKPENTSGRFFMWIHYLDPHADYLRHPDAGLPDFGLKSQRDLYDGEVAYTDQQVGRLLEAIRQAPWGERTAVIVSSDHGEAFGEHDMHRHGFEVWEVLVRVPLIVHVPGRAPARISARRSLIDLVPTILDLMHVEPPPAPTTGDDTDFLSGTSLLPDLFLPEGASPQERDIFVDMPEGPYNDRRRALIHGDLKLTVANEARFELYDLATDPEEAKNLRRTDDPRLDEMKERYAALKARLREVVVTGERR